MNETVRQKQSFLIQTVRNNREPVPLPASGVHPVFSRLAPGATAVATDALKHSNRLSIDSKLFIGPFIGCVCTLSRSAVPAWRSSEARLQRAEEARNEETAQSQGRTDMRCLLGRGTGQERRSARESLLHPSAC